MRRASPARLRTPRWRGWRGRTPRGAHWRWWCGNSRIWRRAPPAVSGWSRRCRDRPTGDRSPAARAAGSRRGGGRRRASGEPRAHEAVEPIAHVGVPHPVEDLGAEAVREDAPGSLGGEPAAAEIVELHLVDRAHRRAVGALHIVGIDLELRLAV